jgi:membrane-associated protease RseP (regulator of RpoE activity)
MLAGFVALAAAISVTPVGHEWAHSLAATCSDLYDQAWGLFS